MAQRIPQVHQCPRFEQRIHALRAAIHRSDMERRPSRRGIYPIGDPAYNRMLVIISARRINGQTIRESSDVIRRRRKVDEPREQRILRRGRLRRGPSPQRTRRVGWLALGVGDDDLCGHRVARRRSQPDDVRERSADRLEVRIDSGRRGGGTRRSRQFATQWCTDQAAHLLDGELRFGEEIAEFGEGTLSKKEKPCFTLSGIMGERGTFFFLFFFVWR
jgi:hypothetical protein